MIGIDIVKISRITQIITKFNDKFINRVFHCDEIIHSKKYSSNVEMLYKYFAKRFAAKEAYIKALGSSDGVIMNTISVLNDINGKPMLFVNGKLLEGISVSLSDDGDYAIAAVSIPFPITQPS